MKSYFVFDVESIGLHGEAFAVAGGVFLENGTPQWEFQFACPIAECAGSVDDLRWVLENVPALKVTHSLPVGIRQAFWECWEKAKREGATMAAECLWPVEAGFVSRCVADDPEARKWNGPYPFLEISSFLVAAGMDPMATYPRLAREEPAHSPLCDARQSARLLAEALLKLPGGSAHPFFYASVYSRGL